MPQIFEAHSLVVALFGLLMASSSFYVQAQVRTESGLPTFPVNRQINSPRAVEDLWRVYEQTGDISLVSRLITAAAQPMEGQETTAGPLPPDKIKNDPSKNSPEEAKRIAKDHFVISEARWSLSYYIVRNPNVKKLAEKRRKNATGNEKAMLDFVFTHPPRSNTFLGELKLEMDEQKKAVTPVATKSGGVNN